MAELLARAIVEEDMKDDPVSPDLLDSMKTNLRQDGLSPEDLAWADSCLNKDVDASGSDWSSIKDALLDVLSSQRGPFDASTEKGAPSIPDDNPVSREYKAALEFVRESLEDEDLLDIESIEISDDDNERNLVLGRKRGIPRGKSCIEDAFRPNYTETFNLENGNSFMDPSLTPWEAELSSDGIFKVWDLEVTDEQDVFTAQLKAFSDIPQTTLLETGNSGQWEDVMHDSVDNLVAGIADLSLNSARH